MEEQKTIATPGAQPGVNLPEIMNNGQTAVAIPTDLQELGKFIEIKENEIEVVKAFLKTQHIPPNLVPSFLKKAQQHAEILLRAQLEYARQLKDIPKSPGQRPDAGTEVVKPQKPKTKKEVLKELGIKPKDAWIREQLTEDLVKAAIEEAEKDNTLPSVRTAFAIKERAKNEIKKKEKDKAEQETFANLFNNNKLVRPDGLYDVIYAEPPYQRGADPSVSTLSIDDIKKLDISSADKSVLFIWSNPDQLTDALEIMNAWGFSYKTHIVYDTNKRDPLSKWFKVKHKILLVGIKGDYPAPIQKLRVPSIYVEHMVNGIPDYFLQMIQDLCPGQAYLDVFSRKPFNKQWAIFTENQ